MKDTVTAVLLLGALCLPVVAGAAVAGETIGIVRTVSGAATITRGEKSLPAVPGPIPTLGGKVRPGGPILPRDDGLPLGQDRQVGPRKGTVRSPHGHHRHPGNALRREGMGTFLSMSAIELRKRVPV
jgi:hypothetical protein